MRAGLISTAPMPSPLLSRLLTPKDHDPLMTLEDACRYMLALPKEVAQQPPWREAGLALAALDNRAAEPALIETITRRVELALFMTYRLSLGWRRASYHYRARRAAGL